LQIAYRQFSDQVRVLFTRVLGMPLSNDIEGAILGAVAGTWELPEHRVVPERITAGTPHYALRLSIE
jgi:hypothetical protein